MDDDACMYLTEVKTQPSARHKARQRVQQLCNSRCSLRLTRNWRFPLSRVAALPAGWLDAVEVRCGVSCDTAIGQRSETRHK